MTREKLQFNPKSGSLEWQGQSCPYLDINSMLGDQISVLETKKQGLLQCLDLLELMLSHQSAPILLQESLVESFVHKYRRSVANIETLNSELQKTLFAEDNRFHATHRQIEEYSTYSEELKEQPMSLRLALKPMLESEALLTFYCFKKGQQRLSIKGVSRIRKLVKYVLKHLSKTIELQYVELKQEYLAADIHGLYNLAYKNKS